MEKELFASSVVERESLPPLKLSYFIVRNTSTYGAEILMECDSAFHSALVADITTSEQNIACILQMLRRNCVTPCTLKDVILDLLNKS